MLAKETEEKLWQMYRQKGNKKARTQLIEAYAPLIKYVASRFTLFSHSSFDFDDLVGFGAIGLIQSVDCFQPEKGVNFSTFAISRIKGAILDELRKADTLPRSLRQKERRLREVYEKYEKISGAIPTDNELARELGVGLVELRMLQQDISRAAVLSFEEEVLERIRGGLEYNPLWPGDDLPLNEPLFQAMWQDTRKIIASTIEALPEKDRLVISLYYYEGLTMKEIAKVLEISESRVSQLHTKAILRLRGRLALRKNDLS